MDPFSKNGLENLDNEIEKIHQNSIRMLSELGVRVEHSKMQEILNGSGCKIKGNRVYIPPEIISKTINNIPKSFKLYGRTGKTANVSSGGPTLCTNTGVQPNIYDFENGLVRRSLLKDVEITARILDALAEIDIVYVSLQDATDVPPHMITVNDFVATIENTTKPLIGPGITNGEEAKAIISMSLAIRNDNKEELLSKPPCAPFVAAITPLYFNKESVDALIEIASSGLPLMALTNPVMGATSPYTIAGTVSLGHAEELAIAVMAHSIRPGLPILSFNTPTVADMNNMASTTGGPETGFLRSIAVRLANHLGIPSWGHGHTSSTRIDEQAADEKSLNALLIALARPSLLGGLGGMANVTLTSYETMVMDNERFAAIRRILKGVSIDEDHLAYGVVSDMVGGQTVISHDHTLKHLYGDEVWKPELARRQGLVNGKPDFDTMRERARQVVGDILKNHRVEPIENTTRLRLNNLLEQYNKRIIKS